MARWCASALATVLCACSLTTSLDGLSGGASNSADGGAQTDGGSPGDPSSGCDQDAGHLLCDDFDHGPLPGPWGGTQIALGAMSLDPNAARSKPSSLSVALSPASGTTRPQAFLAKVFTVKPSTLTLAFDARFDAIDSPESTSPIVIASMLLSQGSKYGVHLVLVGTSLSLWEEILSSTGQGGTSAKHPLPNPATLGDWRRYRIELRIAATGLATVWRDDAQVVSEVVHPTVVGGTPLVGLGVSSAGIPSPGVSAHFDNVTIDAR